MGCCGSSDDIGGGSVSAEHDQKITGLMNEGIDEESRTLRVLLLGAGGAGKTTLLKHLRKRYTTEEPSLHRVTEAIKAAMIEYISVLCKNSTNWSEVKPQCCVRPKHKELCEQFAEGFIGSTLTDEYVGPVKALWGDPGIQATFSLRNEFPFAKNVPYFMDTRLDDIALPSFVPNWEDYIRFRVRTTGHMEELFTLKAAENNAGIEDLLLKVTDVGGQHAERKKWLGLFEETNIHGVVYMVSAVGYDTCLFEDEGSNRWRDSLELFRTLAEKGMFDNRYLVLYFNHADLFHAKIESVPVTAEFKFEFEADEEFHDPHDSEQVLGFFFKQFMRIYNEVVKEKCSVTWRLTDSLQPNVVDTLIKDLTDGALDYRIKEDVRQ